MVGQNDIIFRNLTEDKGGKNLHLEHLEDEILNYGVDGGRAALNFLRSLRDMLSGSARSSLNMTVKWDGAPAIFAGIEPETGDFFVAKKSVFNVNPKLYKTDRKLTMTSLAHLMKSLKLHLQSSQSWVSKVFFKVILCLLMMWKQKLSMAISITLFSLTLLSMLCLLIATLGKTINKAKVGIVWHTTYTGDTLQGMTASFGADISGLK